MIAFGYYLVRLESTSIQTFLNTLPNMFNTLLNMFNTLPNMFSTLPNRFNTLPNMFNTLPNMFNTCRLRLKWSVCWLCASEQMLCWKCTDSSSRIFIRKAIVTDVNLSKLSILLLTILLRCTGGPQSPTGGGQSHQMKVQDGAYPVSRNQRTFCRNNDIFPCISQYGLYTVQLGYRG